MSRYTLMDYFSIYVEEWDSLLEEFLRHLAMTSFSVVLALIEISSSSTFMTSASVFFISFRFFFFCFIFCCIILFLIIICFFYGSQIDQAIEMQLGQSTEEMFGTSYEDMMGQLVALRDAATGTGGQ